MDNDILKTTVNQMATELQNKNFDELGGNTIIETLQTFINDFEDELTRKVLQPLQGVLFSDATTDEIKSLISSDNENNIELVRNGLIRTASSACLAIVSKNVTSKLFYYLAGTAVSTSQVEMEKLMPSLRDVLSETTQQGLAQGEEAFLEFIKDISELEGS